VGSPTRRELFNKGEEISRMIDRPRSKVIFLSASSWMRWKSIRCVCRKICTPNLQKVKVINFYDNYLINVVKSFIWESTKIKLLRYSNSLAKQVWRLIVYFYSIPSVDNKGTKPYYLENPYERKESGTINSLVCVAKFDVVWCP